MQTRLYVYLDPEDKTIHLITLGDKRTQKTDIKTASDFVEGLTSRKPRGSNG